MPLLADLFSLGDRVKRRVKELAADPLAYLEQLTEQTVDDAGRPQSVGQVVERTFNPTSADVEAAAQAWDMPGPAGALAGILRRGGDETLAGVHQMDLGKLGAWLENAKLPREIYSPSVALNRQSIPQNFGQLTMVMRPDALDPGSGRVAGKIWNRDAYTPRTGEFQGGFSHDVVQALKDWDNPIAVQERLRGAPQTKKELLQTYASERNWDKFSQGGFNDLRLQEGQGGVGLPFGQEVAIMSSPTMRSFKEYENNPRGAALLSSDYSPQRTSELISSDFFRGLNKEGNQGNNLANSFLGDRSPISRIARELSELKGDRGYKQVSDLLREWKKGHAYLPSEYGELKITGPVRMDATNWAGALVDPEYAKFVPDYYKVLRELLNQRGIPVMEADPANMFNQARLMSERARPVYGR